MKKSNFFNTISDGIIESDFYFEVSDYDFIVFNHKRDDAYYNPPIIESGLEGECIIYYQEDEKRIIADIYIPNFDWNNFYPELVSKITSKDCKIEKDDESEFWTVSIPFKDMNNLPYESYKMEFMFVENQLISITFIETKIDRHFGGTMKCLQLIGELRKEVNV